MTKSEKYTPGPWKLVKNAHGWFLKTKDGCIIGGVNRFPETALLASQCEPNARLIAAAPDLLEALRDARRMLLDCGGYDVSGGSAANAMHENAIAKAGAV